jgi:hypothetical protein
LLLGLAGLLLVRVSDAFAELAQQLQVEPHTALVAEPRVSSETVPTGAGGGENAIGSGLSDEPLSQPLTIAPAARETSVRRSNERMSPSAESIPR